MSEQSQRRITGSEMEWSIVEPTSSLDPHTVKPLNPIHLSHVIKDYLAQHQEIGVVGQFLGNGARLYVDVGEHLEYATPEDDSYMGTVANEMAGERIVRQVVDRVIEARSNLDKLSRCIYINKRVGDDRGETWGYHQNFHLSPNPNLKEAKLRAKHLELYGTYAAVRNVLFGAGKLQTDGSYTLAQKALDIKSDAGSGTTSNKPLLNLRYEPHTNDGSDRYHDTSSDPNISPWAMFMSKATGSLVLHLIEEGITIPELRFKEPTHVISRQVAMDVELQRGYTLTNNEQITALQVMETFYRYFGKLGNLTDEESRAIEQGQKAVADMQQDLKLVTKVDWLVKRSILERYHEKHGESWNSTKMRSEDRRYDRIGPGSIGQALREKAWADDMPPEKTIVERMSQPPQSTRAFIRGHFIKKHTLQWNSPSAPITVNWSKLKGPSDNEEYTLNPHQNYHPEFYERYFERPAS